MIDKTPDLQQLSAQVGRRRSGGPPVNYVQHLHEPLMRKARENTSIYDRTCPREVKRFSYKEIATNRRVSGDPCFRWLVSYWLLYLRGYKEKTSTREMQLTSCAAHHILSAQKRNSISSRSFGRDRWLNDSGSARAGSANDKLTHQGFVSHAPNPLGSSDNPG